MLPKFSRSKKAVGGDSSRRSTESPYPTRSATGVASYSLLFAASLLWPLAAAASDKSVWPLMPYQVQVYLAVAPEPSLGPRLQADLSATLGARIEAVIGPAWNVSVSAPPAALGEAMLHGLAELPGDRVPLPAAEVNKVLLVSVTPAPGGLTVAARDFDVRTRTLSPAVVRPVWQPGVLGNTVLDALVTAFAPLGQIDRWEKDVVFIRAKASALPLGDRRLAMFREGDVLRPIVRYNDREGRFRRAAAAQWSFCVVEKVSPEEIKCRVHTGMRGEVVSRGRGRVEPLVLRVVPLGGSTLLAIQSRTEPKRPLAGYDIYSYPPGQKTAVTRVGRTDRQGQLLIPPADAPLRVLLVRSGNEVLARLPMVPGLEPRLTAEISNDDQRLAAEGFITGLQEELVNVFARRKILMMRVRAAIEAKQFDRASELFDELRRLPTGEQFAARVDKEQERLASNDASRQRKINMLLGDTRQIIDKQLDPREIEDLEQELRGAESGDSTAADSKGPEKKDAEKK